MVSNKVALLIGRAGSSLPGKNLRSVAGRPLLQWACLSAIEYGMDHYFISSDDPEILAAGAEMGYSPILRPDVLATDSARGCDVIAHAVDEITRRTESPDFDILLQHANSVMYTKHKIARAFDLLRANQDATAVLPCYRVEDLHPFRQKKKDAGGWLSSFYPLPKDTSSNRQELPDAFALNHDFWLLKSSNFSIKADVGEPPWPCHGSRPLPLISEPSSDVHSEEDLLLVEDWLKLHRLS